MSANVHCNLKSCSIVLPLLNTLHSKGHNQSNVKNTQEKKFHLLLNRCRLIFPAMIPKTIVYNNYLHSIYHVLGVIHNAGKYMEHMWGLYSDIMLLYYMKDLRITEFSICKKFIESVFRIYCGTIIYTHFLN